jgi:hypothetical protein
MAENPSENSRGSAMRHRFDDFEAFEEAFRGVNLNFRQLDCGSFAGTMTCVLTPSVVLTECALNRHVEQKGTTEPGCWTLGLPLNEEFRMRWRGRDVGADNLMFFRPDEEIDCVSKSGFHAVGITLSEGKGREAKRSGSTARRIIDRRIDLSPLTQRD